MRYNILSLGTVILILSLFNPIQARVWFVHPDSVLNRIQNCLDSCANNDTVLVGPGTYFENIVWPSTNGITLISELGRDTTIIDGDSCNVIYISNWWIDSTTTISGFTIRNGYGANGSGISCISSSPNIRNNIIQDNITSGDGGGIFIMGGASPNIVGNIIRRNRSSSWGGGIYIHDRCSPHIIKNVIYDNGIEFRCPVAFPTDKHFIFAGRLCELNYPPKDFITRGGGILVTSYTGLYTEPKIINNTIEGNVAVGLGGGIYCNQANPDIRNNIISSNQGYGIYVDVINVVISYNNIWNNPSNTGGQVTEGPGSLHSNPLYLDSANNDFHLQAESPCIDAGDPGSPLDPDSTRADMGAFYYNHNGIANEDKSAATNSTFGLKNRPNPFARSTTIFYSISSKSRVNLAIFNLSGQLVETLINQEMAPGQHSFRWQGNKNLSPGIYFIRLRSKNRIVLNKLLLTE